MRIEEFDYNLPQELIAQEPLKERDASRMMVLKRNTGEIIHSYFKELPEFLKNGDLLILNNTKVIKARLFLKKETGAKIVKRALEVPLRQIAENSGLDGAVVVQKVRESKNMNFGFNAEKDEFEDLVNAGIIDPTKVVRTALENATSMGALLLTTETLVSEIPEKKEKQTQTPPPYPEY